MKYVPEISSDFAILDVKKGRRALNDLLANDQLVKLKIVIEAEIIDTWSDDDGVSREFGLTVTSMRWVAEE